jgi:hypothetical protein
MLGVDAAGQPLLFGKRSLQKANRKKSGWM